MSVEKEIKMDLASQASVVFSTFNKLRQERKLCDFIINVGDDAHHVHRQLLIASSEYFRAMLEHDTIENRQGFVEMKGVDPVSVHKAVDFIYSGKASVAKDCISELIHVAYFMQLDVLCEGIGMLLVEDLNTESFYGTKRFSDTYNCTELAKTCKKYAIDNFEEVVGLEELTELDEDFILDVMKPPDVPEIVKYKAFMKWMDFDQSSRRSSFPKMLLILDTLSLPQKFHKYLIETEPMFYESTECMKIMLLAFFKDVQSEDIDISTKNAIACYDGNTKSIRAYNVTSETWELVSEIEDNMQGVTFSIVALGRFLYVLAQNRKVFRFHYLNRSPKWIEVAPMLLDHGNFPPAVVHGRSIYAMGNSGSDSKALEKYDSTTETWAEISGTGYFEVKCQSGICAAGDSLFFLGGRYEVRIRSRNSSHLEYRTYLYCKRLNLDNLNMTDRASMSFSRSSPAVAHHQGNLYVTGGWTDKGHYAGNEVEVYNIGSNTWKTIANLSISPPVRAVVVMDRLFVVGRSKIGEYDTENDSRGEIDNNANVNLLYGCAPITM